MVDVHKRMAGTTVSSPFSPSQFVFSNLYNGGPEMNVNGSITPSSHRYTVPAGKRTYVYRINLIILDASITASKFGGLGALSIGITIKAKDSDDVLLLDFLDGQTIKNNAEFCLLAGTDMKIGPGTDSISIRWTIDKAGGSLILESGEYLEILVQDDLIGLTSFQAMLQGIIEDNT
jgi:hypothetical protein